MNTQYPTQVPSGLGDRAALSAMPGRRATPLTTYRLQLHEGFGFREAEALIPYLMQLGITDLYTSPLFKARPGSLHGYDITDHKILNPELGSEDDFHALALAVKAAEAGFLLDFVPNHMGIDPQSNPWWRDVLENGPSSPFARYFDIDWSPLKPELRDKVLLPILGDPYGAVLERGELRLAFDQGRLVLCYGEYRLPLNPRRVPDVFKHNLAQLQEEMKGTPALREYLSILTELSNLPATADQNPEHIEERQREKEVARERLDKLFTASGPIRRHLVDCLQAFNGQPGVPESFDPLHELLEAQAYRLAYWKTASYEINYRRFFDINQLAGLRMERPEVFDATHERLLELVRQGMITGLRLDHPDGLYDPAAYFEMIQKQAGPLYVVAEKILSAGESLRKAWAISGTSGYDFLNLVNQLWVDPKNAQKLKAIYERFMGRHADSQDILYQSKKLIMSTSMASELNVLAHLLNQISETNRHWRDFTLDALRQALREVVACFPVYRSYISDAPFSPSDELVITKAVARAKEINPAMEASIFDFVRSMLAPQRTPEVPEAEYRRRLEFAMKFQQYTAPVQAKGAEDTAFYRYNVLLSLNEVGGDLERFGLSISDFHQANLERQHDWPVSLLATATHDTKRGEDARARLDVLSEHPEEWEQTLMQWSEINRPQKTILDGRPCPDAIDEYLLYQALLGAWEPGPVVETASLLARLRGYAQKALREAKRHTSWIRPNEAYEKAMDDFLSRILGDAAPGGFLSAFEPFVRRISADGMVNSLSQLTLKMASPGVPDFYQGTELWDWSLVDPDNRRAVDYGIRAQCLSELEPLCQAPAPASGLSARLAALRQLLRHWEDSRIKMLLTTLALRFRKSHPDLFLKGTYIPLKVTGEMADHTVAFAREFGDEKLVVLAPRLIARYKMKTRLWESTSVELPKSWRGEECRHLFTGEVFYVRPGEASSQLSLAKVFATLPVAWIRVAETS